MKYRKYIWFSQILHLLLLLLHEEAYLNNRSSTRLEILRAIRFSSDIVHRHIIFLLTLLLPDKLMIIIPDNTIMQAVPMSKQVNHVNIEPEILHGNWSSYWKCNVILLLTLLLLVHHF